MTRPRFSLIFAAACLLAPAAAIPQDHEAPRIVPQGPAVGYGERLVLGPGARLTVAGDAAGLVYRLDGEEVAAEAFASGWEAGGHVVSVAPAGIAAADDLVNLAIVFDPEPPELAWEEGDLELLERHGLDQGERPRTPPRRVATPRQVPWLWSDDGRRWLPLLPKGDREATWEVLSDRPQVFLWRRDAPRGQRVRRVWAHDVLSAVERLELVVAGAEPTLTVRAVDLVGNVVEESWPVARR